MFSARQGDVMVRQIAAIPASAKEEKPKDGRVVLAYGEVTGHAHAFYGGRVHYFMETGSGGVAAKAFIRVAGDAPAELKHEEHGTIAVPPGDYEVVRQREYSPEAIRQVAD